VRDKVREKRLARLRRHLRVRKKVWGTAERPRLSIFRSLNHIYAQIIDDDEGKTIVSASSLKIELPSPASDTEENGKGKGKKKAAGKKILRSRAVGKAIAEAAIAKGIKKVRFDRGGYIYHGRISALAEAARKAGLEF